MTNEYVEGMQDEQERIIKLLGNEFWHRMSGDGTHHSCEMCNLIALIKGEK